jgi:hypothetical protein
VTPHVHPEMTKLRVRMPKWFWIESPAPTGTDPFYSSSGAPSSTGPFQGMWPNQLMSLFPWSAVQVLKIELSPT